jgi:hypothetical protein
MPNMESGGFELDNKAYRVFEDNQTKTHSLFFFCFDNVLEGFHFINPLKFLVHAIELACNCKVLDLLKLLLGFMNIKVLCWMSAITNPTPIISAFKTCVTNHQVLKQILEFNPHLLNDNGYMSLEHILMFVDSSNTTINGHSFFLALMYLPCLLKDTPFFH